MHMYIIEVKFSLLAFLWLLIWPPWSKQWRP